MESELARTDAVEHERELREDFADTLRALLAEWEKSNREIDRMRQKEVDAYKADIAKYKREISELKQRLAIA